MMEVLVNPMSVVILQYINISDQYLKIYTTLYVNYISKLVGRIVQLIPEVHRVILGHKAL